MADAPPTSQKVSRIVLNMSRGPAHIQGFTHLMPPSCVQVEKTSPGTILIYPVNLKTYKLLP